MQVFAWRVYVMNCYVFACMYMFSWLAASGENVKMQNKCKIKLGQILTWYYTELPMTKH